MSATRIRKIAVSAVIGQYRSQLTALSCVKSVSKQCSIKSVSKQCSIISSPYVLINSTPHQYLASSIALSVVTP